MSRLLWQPTEERLRNTNMFQFMQYVNQRHGKNFNTYGELYEWSVSDIPQFWATIWDYGEVICSRGTYIRVLAADIGKKLGCCAHLVELRRLGSGIFSVAGSLAGELLKRPEGQEALLAGMITVEKTVSMLNATDSEETQPVVDVV